MHLIKAIIVEDDPGHCQALTALLALISVPVKITAACTGIADAVAAINTFKPELIFLDIDLGMGESGFELLKRFEEPAFGVIFTTQHNTASNAIGAIRACAIDFLPKPVQLSELENALQRFNSNLHRNDQLKTLKDNLKQPSGQLNNIWIENTEGAVNIATANIIYGQSDNSYTTFYLADPVQRKMSYVSSHSIKHWEKGLQHSGLCRIHNRYLANKVYVDKYKTRLNGAVLTLKNGLELPVSRSRKDDVKQWLRKDN